MNESNDNDKISELEQTLNRIQGLTQNSNYDTLEIARQKLVQIQDIVKTALWNLRKK